MHVRRMVHRMGPDECANVRATEVGVVAAGGALRLLPETEVGVVAAGGALRLLRETEVGLVAAGAALRLPLAAPHGARWMAGLLLVGGVAACATGRAGPESKPRADSADNAADSASDTADTGVVCGDSAEAAQDTAGPALCTDWVGHDGADFEWMSTRLHGEVGTEFGSEMAFLPNFGPCGEPILLAGAGGMHGRELYFVDTKPTIDAVVTDFAMATWSADVTNVRHIVYAGDHDGDGRSDALLVAQDPRRTPGGMVYGLDTEVVDVVGPVRNGDEVEKGGNAGDTDGDGYDDVWLTVTAESYQQSALMIFRGGPERATKSDSDADFTLTGPWGTGVSAFRRGTALVGDLNGDEVPDVAASSPDREDAIGVFPGPPAISITMVAWTSSWAEARTTSIPSGSMFSSTSVAEDGRQIRLVLRMAGWRRPDRFAVRHRSALRGGVPVRPKIPTLPVDSRV